MAFLAAASVLLSGCSGDARPTARSPVVVDGTVRVAAVFEIPDFHPYSQFGSGAAQYAYDPLVHVTSGGEVVPGLATSWRATSRTADFTLRRGVTCSDGTVLKASDVARSLTHAADPRSRFVGARSILPSVPFTVTADDRAGTVSVRMSSPYSFVVRSVGTLPVVCPAGLRDPHSLARGTNGTGPYVLSSYASGGPYVFVRRKGYAWGPGGARTGVRGQPQRIVLSVVSQESTAANLLLTGGVNIARLTGPDRARLAGHGLTAADVPAVVGLTFFNQRRGRPLGDPAVRRALVAALDRQGLANVAVGGSGRPAADLTAADAVCHADLAAAHLPSGAAARTLRDAGWTKGADGTLVKDGRPLRLRVISSPDLGSTLPAVGELMAATWEGLGVRVELVSESLNALVSAMYQDGNFDVVVGTSPGPALPAGLIPYLSGPPPARGLNFARIANPTYARLVAQALREPEEASCPTWKRATAEVFRAADALPVADGTSTVYGYRTTFSTGSGGDVVPTSIRLHR
ncbi:ABC transporter substrate-binding protein [Streptomyces sp. NBC_01481]|uniref:ABC transporter substrate-binding protein n=1 Tax=Streptomyces sp. NBC_01481 TaxID=2975869 RepID=UPI0022558166|nr:ABC transporter substrate-binding protein [Streptomyces sp. NBC_01481]MCX4587279.1 ABC transporter substrate-binding protein [Streptomyces sp. NBC_01481]